MPHFDARSLLRHGLTTAVFCCAIALALTVSGQGAWDVQLAYSLGIGLVSWLVIDLGRVLLAPGTGWPHGWRGGVLIAAGIATGYVLGSVIGNAYSGSTQHLPHQHGAMSALVITIAAGASNQFVDETVRAALSVRRTFPQTTMQDLPGSGNRGEQRVIAQHVGVAVAGALFRLADHLTDRRVDIDHERARCCACCPRPLTRDVVHGFELADMTERERPQERAERRGCHHPMRHHRLRRPGTQHVGMIDVRTAGEHRVHQRQHLAPR